MEQEVEDEEEMVCQHCDSPCWLKEDPCAMAEMKRRMEGEATVERDSLEAFFLRLLLLDNIKQEAQVIQYLNVGRASKNWNHSMARLDIDIHTMSRKHMLEC